MSDLSDHLAGEIDRSAFSIDSLESANLAMRHLANAQRRINEKRELALAEARRISDWVNTATHTDLETARFFENSLKAYMEKVRAESGEKSLSLPDGEVHSRHLPAKAEVADIEVFVKWCLDNHREAWIRTKESANLDALKGEVEFSGDLVVDSQSGEVIDGLVAIEDSISVSVKVVSQG